MHKFEMYFMKDGTPAKSREEFAAKFEDEKYRRVDWTSLSDGTEKEFVSTVWLGINHAFGPGRPLIFETMAFYDDDWRECRRYATEAEAKEGHKKMVAEIMARRYAEKSGLLRSMDVEED